MWESVKIEDKKLLCQIADMTKEYYGDENDIANEDYLEHEYFCNPEGNVLMQIAWNPEKKEVAGQYAAIPMKIKVDDLEGKALMSVNTLTKESYRGQGIFKQLATTVYNGAQDEGYQFVYGMPNQNSYPGFLKYLKFQDIGAIPLYVRPLVPSNIVHTFLNKPILENLSKPFNKIYAVKSSSDVEFVDFHEGAKLYANLFWENIKNKYRIMVSRNYEYMKFRFIDIPRRDYMGFYVLVDGNPIAYAIGRVMNVSNISCGMIADFLYIPGYEKEAKCLLDYLMVELRKHGADMAGCMVPSYSSEATILKKSKFFKCPKFMEPQPFRFIFRILNEEDQNVKVAGELKNWYFTMGDYDVV